MNNPEFCNEVRDCFFRIRALSKQIFHFKGSFATFVDYSTSEVEETLKVPTNSSMFESKQTLNKND